MSPKTMVGRSPVGRGEAPTPPASTEPTSGTNPSGTDRPGTDEPSWALTTERGTYPELGWKDAVAETIDVDEGNCAYCGEIIYGRQHVTREGMRLGTGDVLYRWDQWTRTLDPWHADCHERYVITWRVNANGCAHRAECRYAEPDGLQITALRKEVEWLTDAERYCRVCAPIDFWWEPYIGGSMRQAPIIPWGTGWPPRTVLEVAS